MGESAHHSALPRHRRAPALHGQRSVLCYPRCAEGSKEAVWRGKCIEFDKSGDAGENQDFVCGSDLEEGVGGAKGGGEELVYQYLGGMRECFKKFHGGFAAVSNYVSW